MEYINSSENKMSTQFTQIFLNHSDTMKNKITTAIYILSNTTSREKCSPKHKNMYEITLNILFQHIIKM